MNLVAFNMSKLAYYRLAEIGELVFLTGGLAMFAGALTPANRRMGDVIGGGAIAIGFALLLVATQAFLVD
jgi:hypothetical protein